MPIYEYRCHDCKRRVSILWRCFRQLEDKEAAPHCPRCGGTNLTRLISRVAVVRSEEGRLDDLADPSMLAGLDEEDPKSVARWMRRMSREAGDLAGGEDMGDID
jgi:putative FmdB family regulatory protein